MSTLLTDWRHRPTHRRVWALAAPMILSNISVPLVALVDSMVIGHLPHAHQLGAVAVGASLYTFLAWAMGFLRMGSTGFAAQAPGAEPGDRPPSGTASDRLGRFEIERIAPPIPPMVALHARFVLGDHAAGEAMRRGRVAGEETERIGEHELVRLGRDRRPFGIGDAGIHREAAASQNIERQYCAQKSPDFRATSAPPIPLILPAAFFTAKAELLHRGSYQYRLYNNADDDKVPSYNQVNLFFSFAPAASHWDYSLTVTNLQDRDGVNSRFSDPYGSAQVTETYIAPRQYIFSVQYSF